MLKFGMILLSDDIKLLSLKRFKTKFMSILNAKYQLQICHNYIFLWLSVVKYWHT